MKKYLTLVLLLSFLLIGILSACDDGGESESNESTTNESASETSETNTEEEEEEEEEASIDSGFVEVNETYTVNGLDIKIENIEITDDKVRVAMTIVNNSDTTKTFYPDQGFLVVGNKQVEADIFATEGDLSGDIFGGVEKSGVVIFNVADSGINFDEASEIVLRLGDVFDEESFNAEEFSETIAIK